MNTNIILHKLARVSIFLVILLLQGCFSIPGNEINETELQPSMRIAAPVYVEFRAPDSETHDAKKLRDRIEKRLVQYGFTLDENEESHSTCKVVISYERKGGNFLTELTDTLAILTLFILPSYTPYDHTISIQIIDRKTKMLLNKYMVRETATSAVSIFMANVKPNSRYWHTNADKEAHRKLRKATASILTNDRILKECYEHSEIQ